MAEMIKSNKPLAVNPLKASQPLGAILAFLGIDQSIPMLHGSQGCSAFAKVFLVRHFREPIPLQTTAMDQTTTVMGADDNVIKGLETVIEKRQPQLIGVASTGLSETQGSDLQGLVKRFYQEHPDSSTRIVPVVTPDFTGGLESGYALAVEAMIQQLVPASSNAGELPRQVNLLASSMLTVADLEYLRDLIESFGLEAVILPDLSRSLDGHLTEEDFVPVTTGGTRVEDFERLGQSGLTLVVGASLNKAADLLKQKTGVPDLRFNSLMGLKATDHLVQALHDYSGQPVAAWIERQRSQLQDAQLDSHFMLGMARVALAADPDLLFSFTGLVQEMGAEVVAAVTPHKSPLLEALPIQEVLLGDLDDLEKAAGEAHAQLLIGNAHAAQSAERLKVPLIRAGWPIYDRLGAQHQLWIGYRGSRETLFLLANHLLAEHHQHEIPARVSRYAATSSTQEADHASLKTG